MTLKLNIIVGSTRPGRVGPTVAQWLAEFATAHGKFEVELVDLAEFKLPLLDEAAHPIMQQYQHEPTKQWSARGNLVCGWSVGSRILSGPALRTPPSQPAARRTCSAPPQAPAGSEWPSIPGP